MLVPIGLSTDNVKYLSCKDRDPRCSLSAASGGERVACGSQKGGIHVWDVASSAALHFVTDGVCQELSPFSGQDLQRASRYDCLQDQALSIAFQAQSAEVFFSASSLRTLSVWDCRALKV